MLSLPPSGGTGNKIDPAKLFGEDRYDKIYQELLSDGRIEGENLTPDERKEGVKAYRKGKINFVKFITRIDAVKTQISSQKSSATPLTPKLALAPAVAPTPPESEPQKEDDSVEDEDIDGIDQKLDDLLDEIRTQGEIEDKQQNKERKDKEKEKRKKKENKLESVKKFLLAPITKVLKPINDIFKKIIDSVVKIIFAKALIKLIDWFSDPENRGKLDAIFRFITDFWPGIAAGFLLVGAALAGFGILALGKIAVVAAGLIGLTVGLAALAKALFGPGEEEKKTDKALKDDYGGDKDKMIADLEKEKEDLNWFEKNIQGKGSEIDEQIEFLKTGKPKSYAPEKEPDKEPEKDVKPPKDKEPPAVSGRFDMKTGQGFINNKPVSIEEYQTFTNMSAEEKAQKYGTVKLNVGGVVPGPEVLKLNAGGVVPEEMSLLQRLNQNFGDLPFIGGVIKTALNYEDRANYRDADPRLREMMGLTESKPKPRGLQFKDGKTGGLGGFLGNLFGGNKKSKKDNTMASMGTDTVPAMLTPGESVLQVGARERMMKTIGVDPLSFNIGPNANKPKVTKGVTYAAGGGKIEVKGTGNSIEGTLKMKDASGKQVGKTYGVISGTNSGMSVPQSARSTTRNAPIPDGDYKLVGFEKHGPWPGLSGIGDWSAYIGNGSGSIGSRSGLMLHSDINSDGTLGCIGVELGGKAGTNAEQEFLKTYQAINPESIKIALGSGGGDSSEIASVNRTATADNSPKLAPKIASSPRTSSSAITPPSKQSGGAQQSTSVIPVNAASGSSGGARAAGSDVPMLGSVDPLNLGTMVIKAILNIGGL
tara:strand:- start:21790 stop:24246 length:2457 start_codon:yes stop_codon:yes gene_type:complete